FLADAASYAVSLVILLLIRAAFEEARTGERHHVLAEINEGIHWLFGQHYILIVNLAASVTNAFFQIVILVVIVAERNRGASATLIGIALACFGIGGVIDTEAGVRI